MILEKTEVTFVEPVSETSGSDTTFTASPDSNCFETTVYISAWAPAGITLDGVTADGLYPVTKTICDISDKIFGKSSDDGGEDVTVSSPSTTTTYKIITAFSSGWNSWARSVENIPVGYSLDFTVGATSAGVFVGLGRKNMEGVSIGEFAHAILVDAEGIHVVESDYKKKTLTTDTSATISIQHNSGNKVSYTAGGGLYLSDTPTSQVLDTYAYAYLYDQEDTVVDAAIVEGAPQYGACTMTASQEATIINCDIVFTTVGTQTARFGASCIMSGGVTQYVSPSPGVVIDPNPLAITLFSAGFVSDGFYGLADVFIVLNSDGQVASSFATTRSVAIAILSSGAGQSTFTLVGEFAASFISDAAGMSLMVGGASGKASLDSTARVWVVNMDTSASSQYDDYGFNSFFESEGKYYGVADDGIYLLDGDNDEGIDIDALIDFGRSTLGTPHKKTIPKVYAGVTADDTLLLKVNVDGQEYIYEARDNSADMTNTRFDLGRGLKGNYYNFTLLNQNGCDFDLDSIHFEPIISKRKI